MDQLQQDKTSLEEALEREGRGRDEEQRKSMAWSRQVEALSVQVRRTGRAVGARGVEVGGGGRRGRR